MYEYTISKYADNSVFDKQCTALERHLPNLTKGRLLHDVDNSKVQYYLMEGHEIAVHNNFEVGAVWISSQIDLTQYFNEQ